jgi:hypothetical protein
MIVRASLLKRFLFPSKTLLRARETSGIALTKLRGLRASSHMRLSPEDLGLATSACRALAQRYREDAKRFENVSLRESALQRAKHIERVADFFQRQRDRA